MNLIALPHTNEFVRIFNIGKIVKVGEDFDELLQSVEPHLRPVALVLRRTESQEEAAEELGVSRAFIQRSAAIIRGVQPDIEEPEFEPMPEVVTDKTDREKRISHIIAECRSRGMNVEQIKIHLDRAGATTTKGTPFSTRSINRWAEARQIPYVSKAADLHKIVLELRSQKLCYRLIAERLNEMGIKTVTGKGIPERLGYIITIHDGGACYIKYSEFD